MPTYKNEKPYTITWRRRYWSPGDSKEIPFFLPAVELGLTQVSDDPVPPSQILFSGEVTVKAEGAVEIPVPYCRSLYIQALTEGEDKAEIHLGGKVVVLNERYGLDLVMEWDRLGTIKLTSTQGAVVSLLLVEVI